MMCALSNLNKIVSHGVFFKLKIDDFSYNYEIIFRLVQILRFCRDILLEYVPQIWPNKLTSTC